MASLSLQDPLQITLEEDSPHTVFSEGDVVRGTVRVDSTRLTPSRVSITFKGKAVSQIVVSNGNSTTTRVGKSTLFQYDTELFAGGDIAALAAPGEAFVAFPFEFRFPDSVQGHTQLGTNLKPSPDFESEPGHRLPPNIDVLVRSRIQSVRYTLKAAIPTTHLKLFAGEKTRKKALSFMPVCTDAEPAIAPALREHAVAHTRQSRRLHPDWTPPHGFRAHFRDLLPSSSDPAATFVVTTLLPATIRAGYPFSVAISVVHRDRSPELKAPPPLHLRAVSVSIKAITRTRVAARGFATSQLVRSSTNKASVVALRWGGVIGDAQGQTQTQDPTQPLLLPEDSSPLPLSSLLPPAAPLRVPRGFFPTFKTYGLARTYVLKAHLNVECGGKEFDIEAAGNVVVLPWVGVPGGGEEEGAALNGAGGLDALWIEENEDEDVDEMPPPSYEEVVGGAEGKGKGGAGGSGFGNGLGSVSGSGSGSGKSVW